MDSTSSSEKISIQSADSFVAAGFWRRFVAVFLDGIIIGVATFPIGIILGITVQFVSPGSVLLLNLASWAVNLVAVYFYYGYFYSNKGASPGKMVMGLRVINSENGKNLTYLEAFLREAFGKLISALPLFIGYLMAAFRGDKKALHDLIFKTQVLHQESK